VKVFFFGEFFYRHSPPRCCSNQSPSRSRLLALCPRQDCCAGMISAATALFRICPPLSPPYFLQVMVLVNQSKQNFVSSLSFLLPPIELVRPFSVLAVLQTRSTSSILALSSLDSSENFRSFSPGTAGTAVPNSISKLFPFAENGPCLRTLLPFGPTLFHRNGTFFIAIETEDR